MKISLKVYYLDDDDLLLTKRKIVKNFVNDMFKLNVKVIFKLHAINRN